jgi:glycosyltransferase involved in cell wall biosynthesis
MAMESGASGGRRLRVLIVAPYLFHPCRLGISLRRVAHVLSSAGHSVGIVAVGQHGGETVDGCQLHLVDPPDRAQLPQWPGTRQALKVHTDSRLVIHLLRLYARQPWDVTHVGQNSLGLAALFSWLRRTPFIWQLAAQAHPLPDRSARHQLLALRWREKWERALLMGCRGIVVPGEAAEQWARTYAAAIPVVRFEPLSLISRYESPLPTEPDPALSDLPGTVVMYVGHLERRQGIDMLLDAFVYVYLRLPECRLVIVGGHPAQLQAYRQRAETLGIIDRVHFVGPRPVDHLSWCLKQADVLVSPRPSGLSAPTKVYSYMASGVPIVATRTAAHQQVLDDRTALLVAPTAIDLAAGIVRLIRDEQLSQQLAEAAYAKAVHSSDPRSGGTSLVKFYSELARDLG